jgi:lactoylglutathione lyase
MPTQFNHIALYVADLKRSTAFYRDVIGAEVIADPFQDDRHVWLKIGDHNQLHLVRGSQSPDTGNMHFAFAVSSLDEFISRLKKARIRYDDGHGGVDKIRLRPDDVKQIYFQDPDGYWIEANEDRY